MNNKKEFLFLSKKEKRVSFFAKIRNSTPCPCSKEVAALRKGKGSEMGEFGFLSIVEKDGSRSQCFPLVERRYLIGRCACLCFQRVLPDEE
jgi:hypothetical protein